MMLRCILPAGISLCCLPTGCSSGPTGPAFSVVVEAEETLYEYEPADNGTNPMWCHGNTCIVRWGDRVLASGQETLTEQEPYNNTRWMLFERDGEGWDQVLRDELNRTREPSPLGISGDGRLWLSMNPTLTPPGTFDGPAQPQILQFDADDLKAGQQVLIPLWNGSPMFKSHSYRSFSVDGPRNEMILFQNEGDDHVLWSFRNGNGEWTAAGLLEWPWAEEYEVPVPIRICYPAVQLRNREVHFLGVSDIVEPNNEWKDFKFELTGRKWDYDFRRLFYTCTEDITGEPFRQWLEVASREETAGHIFPCDLWCAEDGRVHILWTERALDERLVEEFFPGEKQNHALNYAVIKNGEVISRKAVMYSEEGDTLIPGRGRFHVTPLNRLFILYFVQDEEKGAGENRVVEVLDGPEFSWPIKVELREPFSSFFTATVRAGCNPSDIVDILGKDERNMMRYARVRIVPGE